MKSFEIKAFGLEEMKSSELADTNGGSLIALAVVAVAAILVSACSCSVEVNVNSPKTKEGGTDVNTDVEVSVV